MGNQDREGRIPVQDSTHQQLLCFIDLGLHPVGEYRKVVKHLISILQLFLQLIHLSKETIPNRPQVLTMSKLHDVRSALRYYYTHTSEDLSLAIVSARVFSKPATFSFRSCSRS